MSGSVQRLSDVQRGRAVVEWAGCKWVPGVSGHSEMNRLGLLVHRCRDDDRWRSSRFVRGPDRPGGPVGCNRTDVMNRNVPGGRGAHVPIGGVRPPAPGARARRVCR